MIKARSRKESEDERKTSKEWRDLGNIELKIEKCNHNGWPDRYYRSASLNVRFWCEWKRIDTKPSPEQAERHRQIRAQGDIVIVAHSRREFWELVRKMQAGEIISDAVA